MDKFTNPLKHVRVAAPCSADWKRMRGDERVRFCDQCSMNVYNLSDMTRREAESLLSNVEGRLCVRFYRRKDGTILTNNCPVGLRALKRRVSHITSATLSAVISFFAGLGIMSALDVYRSIGTGETMSDVQSGGVTGTLVVPVDDAPVIGDVVTMGQAVWEKGRAVIPANLKHQPLKLRRR